MIFKIGDRTVEWQDTGFYEGAIYEPPVEAEPELHYKGPRMPLEIWALASAFMAWGYKETGGETQCRFYMHPETGAWDVVIMPQERSTGLYTHEVKEHPLREEALACVKRGYQPIGTGHIHCAAGAFQSGTDHSDEIGQSGLHITLGNLNDPKYSIHSRVTLRKILYPCNITEWIDFPEEALTTPWCVEFPEEWKKRIISPPPPVQYHYGPYDKHGRYRGNVQMGAPIDYEGYGYGYGYHDYDNYSYTQSAQDRDVAEYIRSGNRPAEQKELQFPPTTGPAKEAKSSIGVGRTSVEDRLYELLTNLFEDNTLSLLDYTDPSNHATLRLCRLMQVIRATMRYISEINSIIDKGPPVASISMTDLSELVEEVGMSFGDKLDKVKQVDLSAVRDVVDVIVEDARQQQQATGVDDIHMH